MKNKMIVTWDTAGTPHVGLFPPDEPNYRSEWLTREEIFRLGEFVMASHEAVQFLAPNEAMLDYAVRFHRSTNGG